MGPFRPLKAQPMSETLHLETNTGIRLTALVLYIDIDIDITIRVI